MDRNLVSRRLGAGAATLLVPLALSAPPPAAAGPAGDDPAPLIEALHEPRVRALVRQVLDANPELAGARARERAARQQAPQAASLPDPMLSVGSWILPPETRVGPQQVTATLSQRFPLAGKRGLRADASLRAADAHAAAVRVRERELITEVRRLYHEIAYLDGLGRALRADRDTLVHYEELARARYASGVGLGQAVVKIQAEITQDDSRLLDVQARRAALVAALNTLADRPAATPVPEVESLHHPEVGVDTAWLLERTRAGHPSLARADAEIARADVLLDLARRAGRPDLNVGISYTLVGSRRDAPGLAMPPPDDGSDVLALTASIELPLRRGRLRSAVEEAVQQRQVAVEARRVAAAALERSVVELAERNRLTWQQLRLFDDALLVQAEQSLRSAEAGYAAGTHGALDLLDAERVLLEVHTASGRAHADYAISVARLEGLVGEALPEVGEEVTHAP